MDPVIITSYKNVDLDGFSSSLAYQEFLEHKCISSKVVFHGDPHREVRVISKKYEIKYSMDKKEDYVNRNIILIDHSSPSHISPFIDINKVKTIIDHRKIHESYKFPNASTQIEDVGSCATLITEKFIKFKLYPSQKIANLLFMTIMSNTLKLKANISTKRDRQVIEFLSGIVSVTLDDVDTFFIEKSVIVNLSDAVVEEYAIFENLKIGFAQIEVSNIQEFIKNNKELILKSLEKRRIKEKMDHSIINLVDIIKGEHIIVTDSILLQNKLEKHNFIFSSNISKSQKALFRKEIISFLQ